MRKKGVDCHNYFDSSLCGPEAEGCAVKGVDVLDDFASEIEGPPLELACSGLGRNNRAILADFKSGESGDDGSRVDVRAVRGL
jgi:hypothetical protein